MHAYVVCPKAVLDQPARQRGPVFPEPAFDKSTQPRTTQTSTHTFDCCKVRLTNQSAANQTPSSCFTPLCLSVFLVFPSFSPWRPVLSTHTPSPCPSSSLLSHLSRSHDAHPTKGPVLILFCRCRDPPRLPPHCIASLSQSPLEFQSTTHILVELDTCTDGTTGRKGTDPSRFFN